MLNSLSPRKLRYGLKIKGQFNSGLRVILAVLAALVVSAGAAEAQEATWWGSSSWFDWSDFRGSANGRLFFARLVSASITKDGKNFDLKSGDFSMGSDPEVIREAWFELYIDRLGLRFHVQDHQFHSDFGSRPNNVAGPGISNLHFGSVRLGADLDLIRYPFFRSGINFDYSMELATFQDQSGNAEVKFSSSRPMTIGLHATAIPGRIRDIPIIIEARGRFPIPFYKQNPEVKLTDWEIAGGLRPSIWQTSLYGHTTFAFGVEAGFRSVQVDMDMTPTDVPLGLAITPSQINLKATWQGAFVQLGLSF